MSVSFVRVKSGVYRNKPVVNEVFPLLKQFTVGAKGGFITVDGAHITGENKGIRVRVGSPRDFEFTTQDEYLEQEGATPVVDETVSTETDEEIMDRIKQRFEILDDMTKAAVAGDIRAMIVSGPPGVGKSFGVEQEVEKAVLFDQLSNRMPRCEVVKGATTAIGLYSTLYKYSDKNNVVVFDDCDSVLLDDTSLNLLKGALDTGKKRKISWLSDSHMLRREGIPESFEFKGSVIFITNLKFDNMKSAKLRDHLDALQSRCHYLDLTLDTDRDMILRIKQVFRDAELFSEYNFSKDAENEIIAFMEKNKSRLRELSLRMAIKIADLRKTFPERWEAMAESTVMRRL
jgi:predicted AAA+ superfamily ATPase